MERYEAYKDSGVEWIGEIPAGWKVNKLGNMGTYINGYAFKPNQWGDKGLPIIRIQDLTGSNDSPNYYDGTIDKKYLIESGDLLVSWAATIGVYWWLHKPGWLNQHIFRVLPYTEECEKQFFYWMLSAATDALDNENKHGIMMEHLTLTVFNAFRVPLPPLPEQRAIADYLDAKTAEIDALVADCEREVGLLQEYRKAVISEAVTKGLDPDAPMKDSGIEWIGEIPSTWKTNKLRYCGTTQNGISKGGEYFGTGHPFISYGNAYRNELDKPELFGLIESTEGERERYGIRRGDVLFTRTSETIEEVGIAAGALRDIAGCCFAGFLIRFRPSDGWGVLPEYAAYYFRSDLYRPYLTKEMVLVTRASMSQQLLGGITVLIPSASEQETIVAYLDTRTAEIDSLIEAKQSMAEKLREYRRSLISEVVTGKFKV